MKGWVTRGGGGMSRRYTGREGRAVTWNCFGPSIADHSSSRQFVDGNVRISALSASALCLLKTPGQGHLADNGI